MLSHSTTLYSTGRHYILRRNNPSSTVNSIELPLRKPQILTQNVKPIQITPISTTTSKNKTSNLDIIRLMDTLNHPIPLDIYSSFLRDCTLHSDSSEALQLYNRLIRHRDLRLDSPLIHRLLYMLVSCGQLDIARNLFDKMPLRKDILSWAIVIIGYLDSSRHEEGINLFIKMLLHHNVCHVICELGVILLIGILKACLKTLNIGLGKQLHGLMLKLGGTNDFNLSFSLMDFYGKFGCIKDANFVFNQLWHHHNTAIWTVKIVNSCKQGCFDEVIEDFKEMGRAGITMNGLTFSSVLRACAGMSRRYGGNCGKQVHAMAIKLCLESDALVKCGLIDMYGKCGMMVDAKRVFESNTNKNKKNTVYWNALLMAYVRNGLHIDAIKFLYLMEASQININEKLINHVRIACS